MAKRKSKKKLINKVITCIMIATIAFTVGMMFLFYKFQSVPDTLILAFFGAVFGELSICGMIRNAKIKNDNGRE